MMVKIGIIGATGYVGVELLRLLQNHPFVSIVHVFTESHSGEEIATIFPHFKHFVSLYGEKLDLNIIKQDCDLVFVSLPHGHAIHITQPLLDAGVKVIDMGADFRLKNPDDYQQWYNHQPAVASLLEQAVYGLPEIGHRENIGKASLIANPGCYATASLLASLPAIKANIIDHSEYIFDAKSGVSGAGRSLTLNNHFCEVTENLIPYQLAGLHRHTPEIEQELSLMAPEPVTIQFTPHLLPIIRGLLVTAYFKLKTSISQEDVHAIYQQCYDNEAFIRVTALNSVPQIKHVRGTNYCDIGVYVDQRTHRLIVVSAIDNLIKGAAGQSIQNMNLMYRFAETAGLKNMCAIYP